MMKHAAKILASLLSGFAGGALVHWFMNWWQATNVSPSDAVSIANTYIVFTTIIFVGITVVLAIAGYVLTQQLAANQETQEKQLIERLKEKLKTDEKIGIALAEAILDNPDVKMHLEEKLESKLNELKQEQSRATVGRKRRSTRPDAADLSSYIITPREGDHE